MTVSAWPIDQIRRQFPGLSRTLQGRTVAFFDGPAGSQTPDCVVDAVCHWLRHTNCNRGAAFASGRESDAVMQAAHEAAADFLNADDPDCIVFGPNMTSLALLLSRAFAERWQPGDEIIVTRLDHDANVSPWVHAARAAGATVQHVNLRSDDWTLDLSDFHAKLSSRTRFVAVGLASNATGTINPVGQMISAAKAVGALTFVDAVHYAPHGRISVSDLDCDFLACSAYKFFGPHEGILWGRRELLEQLRPWKLRPSPDTLPGLWMTGTGALEAIAGTAAAINYLASLADLLPGTASGLQRREKLDLVFAAITEYERMLSLEMLSGLRTVPGIRIHGITDPQQVAGRVPTFSWTFPDCTPRVVSEWLAERGLCVWNGNAYALPFTETAGLEPGGTVRAGALHYNTVEEIQRLTGALQQFRG